MGGLKMSLKPDEAVVLTWDGPHGPVSALVRVLETPRHGNRAMLQLVAPPTVRVRRANELGLDLIHDTDAEALAALDARPHTTDQGGRGWSQDPR